MRCSICNSWPTIEYSSPTEWRQSENPVPSNRLCDHLLHFLNCPNCNFTTESAKEQAERYAMSPEFRELVLNRDNFTCQACGYHMPESERDRHFKRSTLIGAEKLLDLFTKSLRKSYSRRQLHVAHYHARYGQQETPENRNNPEYARTLCADDHGFESGMHEIARWNERRKTCPILQKLE